MDGYSRNHETMMTRILIQSESETTCGQDLFELATSQETASHLLINTPLTHFHNLASKQFPLQLAWPNPQMTLSEVHTKLRAS